MNIDIGKLKNAKGMNQVAAEGIAKIFSTYEELAEATAAELVTTVEGIDDEVTASVAILYAKVVLKGMKSQAAQASAQVTLTVEGESKLVDPFTAMLATGSKPTYDPAKAAEMANVMLTYFWDVAGVNRTLHTILKKEGTAYVTDADLADELDTWLIKVDQKGGDMLVKGKQVTVLPFEARQEAWEEVTQFLARSTFDQILRSAAVYRRAVGQQKFAAKMGGNLNVNLPSDVDDPDTIKLNIETALTEMAQTLAGGRTVSRNRKMALEYALVLVPAMNNRDVITSFGIPVGDKEDPLTVFLMNKRNPQPRLQTGMNAARIVHKALAHFATYEPEQFEDFFEKLCGIGQEYCLAIDAFQKTSPKPISVPDGQYVGVRQVVTSLMAMVKVSIGSDGIKVEVNASASVTSRTATMPANDGDLTVLEVYFSLSELQQMARPFFYRNSQGLSLSSHRDVVHHVENRDGFGAVIIAAKSDIIWPSQMQGYLKAATGSKIDPVIEIAEELGIDTGYAETGTYQSAARWLIGKAILNKKWLALQVALRNRGVSF